ncbi:MAG: radical SAM protein, partial [Geobacteraceae bacterium]|nr:radical SAM protein [Geobacteraceae bacterium]
YMSQYGQLDRTDRTFPLYSTLGCPYRCSFCSSPRLYRDMPRKYELIPPTEVADHIEFLVGRYQASYIYFIDDDSFVDLAHVAAIIDEIDQRGLKVRLGFRGARIDEIMRMDDRYLARLAGAGTDILHIGAESGSQRMLDLMEKNLTVQEILAVNRKLARHPRIKAAYNWIIGLPGETRDDLAATRQLVLQIVRDNPAAIIFPPNKYRPLPGTKLYATALEHGYIPPARQEEWGNVEVEGDFTPPWYSPQFAATVNMMQVAAYFIDRKFFMLSTGSRVKDLLLRVASLLYRPLAVFRYRRGITALLIEHWLYIRYSRSFRE